ncbi:MAG: YfhO family protein [Crocinitomicaceae bacterium]|nr:YfhO family protein [Crocinitomicaceae bacterium]
MNFKKIIPHLIAIGVFVLLACVYFSPIFNDYSLKQGDIQQFRGMEKEIVDANLVNDEDALWTNSMFGGMPAYQINVKHPNNFMVQVDKFIKLGLPRPVGLLFMAMLGFYIFALCLRVNPWLGILGAIAFGFSTINILYIGAGHVTKVNAIAYMAPALGGMILAFRGKWLIGSAVFALFFALNLSANHLQMTYYLAFLLAAVAIGEAIRMLIKKELVPLGKVVAALGIGSILAIMPSWGNLSSTSEYSKYTTRGATDLTLKAKGDKSTNVKDGLETNYILEYNYGKGELLSIIAPNAKGERGEYIGNDEDIMMNVDPKYTENIGQMNRYWGGQRMSGGAFYFGVLMLVFALFGLVFLKDAIKWPFLVIAILALLLASNDPGGMNDFFINKVPLYNKFRDSKMILVLLQVMIPAMAVLFLDKLFKKEGLLGNKKALLIGCGVITLVGIVLYAAPSISGSMLSKEETKQFAKALEGTKDPMQADFIQGLKTELINVRTGIYQSDFGRAIGLIILGCGLILLSVYTKVSTLVLSLIGIVAVTADNMSVSKRYLNNEDMDTQTSSWEDVAKSSTPYLPEVADMSILNAEKGNVPGYESKVNALVSVMGEHPNYVNMESRTQRVIAEFGALNLNSDYRVFSFANTFNETGTSYFHKSIGGYHGAKLKRFQEIVDFQISEELQAINQVIGTAKNDKLRQYAMTMEIPQEKMQAVFDTISVAEVSFEKEAPVLNMLNAKYIVMNKAGKATRNTSANGAAWFVGSIKKVNSSNDEMRGLGKLNSKDTDIVNVKDTKVALKNNYALDSTSSIKLTKYGTNELTYTVNAKTELPAIFSEIYYPEGWNCYADGKQIEPFRADYLLRGAVIPAGTKTVVWKFEPQSFYTASKIALIGSLLLLWSVAFILGKALMASLKEKKVEALEK